MIPIRARSVWALFLGRDVRGQMDLAAWAFRPTQRRRWELYWTLNLGGKLTLGR